MTVHAAAPQNGPAFGRYARRALAGLVAGGALVLVIAAGVVVAIAAAALAALAAAGASLVWAASRMRRRSKTAPADDGVLVARKGPHGWTVEKPRR